MMKAHLFTVPALLLTASLMSGHAAFAAGADAARDTSSPFTVVKDGDWDEPRPRFDSARIAMERSLASSSPGAFAAEPRARTPVKDGDWDETPVRVNGKWVPAFE